MKLDAAMALLAASSLSSGERLEFKIGPSATSIPTYINPYQPMSRRITSRGPYQGSKRKARAARR